MQNRDVKAGLFGALFFSAFLILPNPAHAATEVGGMLTESTTWTMANSPYIVRADYFAHEWWTGCGEGYGLSLGTGVVLTIQPGVVVKFDVGTKFLSCQGQLIANGTAALPITFTANTDTPIPEYWQSMKLGPLDQVQHTHISYGSSCITYASSSTIFKFNTVEYCGAALYFEAVRIPLIIEDNILQNSGYGIFMTSSEGATISNNHFENNTGYGISINRPFSASTIENNEINGNWVGISFDYQDNSRISNNNITGNSLYGVLSRNTLNAQDNWWGDPSGPYNANFNPGGLGNEVSNEVDFEPWLNEAVDLNQEPLGKRPVLIVPGVLGTDILKEDEKLWLDVSRLLLPNDRFMDPLSYDENSNPMDNSLLIGEVLKRPNVFFNYAQQLIDDLITQGYQEGLNLYLFPYDWRKDIDGVAQNELAQEIIKILSDTGFNTLDIIAHSQGELVIKRLLYEQPEFQSKINQLIFVGTPHLGAPKAAKALLFGDSMGVSFLKLGLDPEEIKRIGHNMPSVYELLPSLEYFSHGQDYLGIAKTFGPFITGYSILNYDDTEQALKDLGLNSNLIDQSEIFHSEPFDNYNFSSSGILTHNIVGCQEGTISQVIAGNNGRYWLNYGPGDATVPVVSATNLFGVNNFYAKKGEHGTMLSQDGTRQLIVNLITGSTFSTGGIITQNSNDCKFNGKKVSVHSPVDLHIYDQEGNHVGPNESGNIDIDISGVQYDILGEDKFAFLQEGLNYTIKLVATYEGSFYFYSTIIEDNQATSTAFFNDVQINDSSEASINLQDDNNLIMQLDLDGDGSVDEFLEPSAILSGQESQDLINPVTSVSISGIQGQNNFYRSDVSISFTAEDPIIEGQEDETSGILKTLYSLDHGQTFQNYESPLGFSTEREYSLDYYSIDRAGNNEEPQSLIFTIDKSAPEISVSFNKDTKDFVFTSVDNIDSQIILNCTSTQCQGSDKAGNTILLRFRKSNLLDIYNLILINIAYSGVTITFPANTFPVQLGLNSNNTIKKFTQALFVKKQQIETVSYDPTKNTSIIVKFLKSGITTTKVPGIYYLQFKTSQGTLIVN